MGKRYFTATAVAALVGAAGTIVWWTNFGMERARLAKIVPENIRNNASFPLYIPSSLPEGLRLHPEDFKAASSSLISFSIRNGNTFLSVTEQPSGSFDPEKFLNNHGLDGPEIISTASGEGVTGKVAGNSVLILKTDKTLITASSSLPSAQLKQTVVSFKRLLPN